MKRIAENVGDERAQDRNRHHTLADFAYEQLEHLIVTLAYLPGDEISESDVCERLGLGRTPVREAILRLRHTRLIEPGPGRSHIVTKLDYAELLQIMEVARLLDRLLVERAAVLRTSLEARRFAALAESFPACAGDNDVEGYLSAHLALNRLIAEAGHQPVAARTMAPLNALSRRLIVVHVRLSGMVLGEFALHHAGISRALAEGQADEAVGCLAKVLDRWVDIIESLSASAGLQDATAMLRAALASGD